MSVIRSLLFYIAFYGGTVFWVLGAVISAYVAPRAMRWFCDMWSAWHTWCVRHILGIEIRITGTRPDTQAFYAIKHESFFEAIAMPWLFDYPSTFAKQELADLPLWGHASGVYGNIHVARDQGAAALRQMMKAVRPVLAAGRPIVIFPEGTRVPHGTRPELQAGFAALYKLLGLPVVPVAVDSGKLYHRRWKQRGTITIHFGEPIEPGLPRAEIEARVHAAINCLNG